eukprot:XP_008183594.1 PREDICTED: dnaJ homolog subfamily C member 17-like [Acyrthosiphon pisum]
MDSALKDLDLYGILEIQQTATVKEIKTVYRKKALQFHPDKNPNDPKAAQLFLRLCKILTILTDTATQLDYDKSVNTKTAAKLSEKEYDLNMDICNLKKELERLRKEYDLRQQEIENKKSVHLY